VNTYQIVSRSDLDSKRIEDHFKEILRHHGWQITDNPELVISIGGDGTMIKAFQDFYHESTAFVGLHTGTLGFYADWDKKNPISYWIIYYNMNRLLIRVLWLTLSLNVIMEIINLSLF
jgi:NAD kinase